MYNQKHHKFDTFYNHKFGFHITGPHKKAFKEVLRLKPKVVKTMDFSVDVMKNIKEELPDVFLIGRRFVHPQDFGQLSGSTAKVARRKGVEMAELILREEVNKDAHQVNGRPIFNAWESLNEVFPEDTDEDTQKLFDEYQVAFAQKMQTAGFEAIAFNFGQGNGRGQKWLDLYPGTLETYKYLGFHEYDWPTLDRLHNIGLNSLSEPQNRVPVVGEGRGNDGMWRALRYRRIMNEGIRQRYGDQHTVIITECGMTQGVWGGQAKDIGPWATELTVAADILGGVVGTPIPVEDYWKTLLWYNSELMRDDYVMGAALFVTGATGNPDWETFEHLGPILDKLFNFQREVTFDQLPSLVPNPTPSVITAATRPAPEPDLPIEIEGGDTPPGPGDGPETPDPPPDRPEPEPEPEPIPKPEPPQPEPEPPTADPTWRYTLETGPGMGLLVGDIGVANQKITISKPGGVVNWTMSGSKPEFGVGGFETYAQTPGPYVIEFLEQRFEIELTGKFTRITFTRTAPKPARPKPSPIAAEAIAEPAPPPISPPRRRFNKATPKPEPPPAPPPAATEPKWTFRVETGRGLGLLAGDIGIPNEWITITKPSGWRDRVLSGSKREFGPGGFETYAYAPGLYRVEFLGQQFDLQLNGQFNRVIFRRR